MTSRVLSWHVAVWIEPWKSSEGQGSMRANQGRVLREGGRVGSVEGEPLSIPSGETPWRTDSEAGESRQGLKGWARLWNRGRPVSQTNPEVHLPSLTVCEENGFFSSFLVALLQNKGHVCWKA